MTESLEECAARIVRQEIHSDVSQLVRTLAARYNLQPRANHEKDAAPLVDLGDQAIELCAPVNDWEAAALLAGWSQETDGTWFRLSNEGRIHVAGTAEAICEREGLNPYQWEVYEHWAVSLPLGEKLEAEGEKVDFDFAGLVVWARTNTGQSIEIDRAIEAIAADIIAA